MYVEVKRGALIGARWCEPGDVVNVDDNRGKLLIAEKVGKEHVGPETVDITPGPDIRQLPEEGEEGGETSPEGETQSTSQTAPNTKPKPKK